MSGIWEAKNMVGHQQTPIPSDDSLTTSSIGGLLSEASLQARISNYSDPKSNETFIYDPKWAGSDKTICNPMLLPYDLHVRHPPMSQWTLKDNVIGAGDVYTAVQSSAISRSSYHRFSHHGPQRVSAAALNNCIKYERIHNLNETTKERKCLEATAQVTVTAPVCAMRIEDQENVLDDVIKPDVDIEQEKRKNYNSDSYARRKTKKMSKVANGDVSHDVDIQKGNPMLLPYDAHLRRPPMSQWTLKDSVIGTGDVYPAVQSSAISRLSYHRFSDHGPQWVSAAAMNNCIKYESIHKLSETTKERKCLEATVQVAVTAPVIGYQKFVLGDDTIVDVDIEKEKRKKYNSDYYARRKKIKMSEVANVDVSHDIDINKERRKEYNREYYARQKKKKLRKVNAEGNIASWQYPRINNSLHSAKNCAMRAVTLITNKTTTLCDMGELNTEETHVRADKAAQKTSCDTGELNTEETHVSADKASQKRKVYNRTYYLRNKEKNKIRTGVNKQGACQTLTSTAKTITVLNVTGKESVTQVMFGLDS